MRKFITFVFFTILVLNVYSNENESELIIEEYKLVSEDIATPDNSGFRKYIDRNFHEKRSRWHFFEYDFTEENDTKKINIILADYDYFFKDINENNGKDPCFSFCFKDSIILTNIYNIRCFQYSNAEKKFYFLAKQIFNSKTVQYRVNYYKNKLDIQSYSYTEAAPYNMTPIILNNKLTEIIFTDDVPKYLYLLDSLNYAIKQDSEIIYTFSIKNNQFIASSLIKAFYQYENNWILELIDNVIVNGTNINIKNNYSKVFSYIYLKGRPFYFFEKDNQISISYDSNFFQTQYEEVIRNKCCEPGMFNVWNNNVMVSFFALRDGYWYYVEAGVYD